MDKHLISNEKTRPSWVFWFCICLYPINTSEFSINYLFMLTPLLCILFGGRLAKPITPIRLQILLSIAVFAVASIYQTNYYEDFFRRFISLILFLSIFSLSTFRLTSIHLNSFFFASVIIACIISLISVYKLVAYGLVQSAFEAKDEVGSQRYGFFLIFSFWVALGVIGTERQLGRMLLPFTLLLIFAGAVLTFSRATYVSMLFSLIIYLGIHEGRFSILRVITLRSVAMLSFVGGLVYIAAEQLFPSIYLFVYERLIDFFVSGRVFDHIDDSETSEGTRFRIWGAILNYVLMNPLTGSGFLGSWAIVQDTGSAHNQYMDILLRQGFLGFGLFIILLWQVWRRLIRRSRLLASAYGGILVYGFFHETIKEPIGGLLIAVLFGYYSLGFDSRLKGNNN